MQGLSLVAASGGHSSSRCAGLSLWWSLLLWSTGSRRAGSVVVAHGPSCSAACGIFPDQGSNPCSLHWQADSQPLRHQGSPLCIILKCIIQEDNTKLVHFLLNTYTGGTFNMGFGSVTHIRKCHFFFFLAVLGLRFCARAFSSCGKQGPLFITVRGPLTMAASPVVEHRLSSCGSRAQLLRGMWDLPRPGLEPVSPALAGRFSTTAPPGKPRKCHFKITLALKVFEFLNPKRNLF